jgi:hypothetical protein
MSTTGADRREVLFRNLDSLAHLRRHIRKD